MNIKRKIFTGTAVLVLVAGTGAYASESFNKFTPQVKSEHKAEVEAVQNKLQATWAAGKKAIVDSTRNGTLKSTSIGQDVEDWTFEDTRTLDTTLYPSFTEKEKSSFMNAFYSDVRKDNLEVGDYMSGLLVNLDHTKAKVYWQKKDGTFFVIDLSTQKDLNGERIWYVEGSGIVLSQQPNQ